MFASRSCLLASLSWLALSSCAPRAPSASPQAGVTLVVHHEAETPENHRAAVLRLFDAWELEERQEKLVEQTSESMARSFPMDEKAKGVAHKHFVSVLGLESLKEELVVLYLETFTQQELEEMLVFYESPLGRKSARGMMSLSEKSKELGMRLHQRNLPRLMESLEIASAAPRSAPAAPIGPSAPDDVSAPPASAKCTDKGVCYRELSPGKEGGKFPRPDSVVEVHYDGWTTDGKLFDSSQERGPVVFGVSQVIAGWSDGLLVMPEGAKFRFWIPAELAYGEVPQRPGAPAGNLTFDIQLIQIKE